MVRFFKPDYKLVRSIIEYAGDRLIVDLGCGADANFIIELLQEGAKAVIGCDLFLDYHKVKAKQNDISPNASIHLFPGSIEDNHRMLSIIAKHPKGCLFLLCRPCHHQDLIEGGIEVSGDQEILYIGLPKNLERDLAGYNYEEVKLEGTSEDDELILKILK